MTDFTFPDGSPIPVTGWQFDLEDNTQAECPNCKRQRVAKCLNGKFRCEKCDYSPDEQRVITDFEIDGY